jgi:hypothetical protein
MQNVALLNFNSALEKLRYHEIFNPQGATLPFIPAGEVFKMS